MKRASVHGTELWAALGAGLVASAVLASLRRGLGLWGALGTDAPLWGLTARDLWVGASPLVPPLYPALLAPFVAGGASPVRAGSLLSLGAGGALVGLIFWGLRRVGLSGATAALGALLAFAIPDVAGWAFQLQPDSLAALWSVALGLALAACATGHRGAAGAVVLLAALAPLLRTHGLVWAAVATAVLLGSGPRTRWMSLLVPAVLWLAPLLLGLEPGRHPLDFSWSDRAGGALGALTTTDPASLSYLNELHRGDRADYARLVTEGRRLAQLRWHAARSLTLAPDGWLLVTGAFVASSVHSWRTGDRTSFVRALPLLAALPALLIWSQRRHVVLMVPLAIVCLLALRPRRRWIGLLAAALGVHAALNWPQAAPAWQSERPRAEHYAELGSWLTAHAPRGSLLGGVFQDVGLYAPAMGRHDPDGSAADWWTFYVGERPPAPHKGQSWERVHAGSGALAIYQLAPDRRPRPCAGQLPATDTPHLAIARAHAEVPGCTLPEP